MWDEQDSASRWWQLFFGVVLLVVALFFGWLLWSDFRNGEFPSSGWGNGYDGYFEETLFCGAAYLGVRCLWYAITGKDNVNRDDF